jgi:hypothetical protein
VITRIFSISKSQKKSYIFFIALLTNVSDIYIRIFEEKDNHAKTIGVILKIDKYSALYYWFKLMSRLGILSYVIKY